jgi:eukaryotic-like serine/threonine-protein kinase
MEWSACTGEPKPKSLQEEASKTALGTDLSSPNQREAEDMARKALGLKDEGKLADAADAMEEAFNRWPGLRDKYAHQVRLWRCGVSM